ncbi:MAG: chloride channel protein [Bacteroidales bacterium]|nr:chloride channel protein [Bacteroidales bacterium]
MKVLKPEQHAKVLFLSVIIGVWGGLSAVILKNIAFYTHSWVTQDFNFGKGTYLYFVLPLVGLTLTTLFTTYVVRDNHLNHGVSVVLHSISKRFGRIHNHNLFSSMIASLLTITFGGSMGFEAPIILTGSSIGSFLGRKFHVNRKTLIILVGAGASGALSGIFKAPIAAVVFSLEILMIDLTMASLIPLLVASMSGAFMAYLFMGNGVLFSIHIDHGFQLGNLPFYILLGIFTGLVSLYFTRTTFYIEDKIAKIKRKSEQILIGAVGLGIMIFALPSLFGEGYEFLRQIVSGETVDLVNQSLIPSSTEVWHLLLFMALIMMFKVVATAITGASGGVGGVFAPSLFMGGVSGVFFAKLINLLPFVNVSEKNFGLIGMAGVMAGVMHAPLTGIFLVAEFTGGYSLFTPLIFTAIFSYLTISIFEKHSIYTKRLAAKGELMTHHKDKAVLQMMTVNKLIEKNFKTIHKDAMLSDLVKVLADSERNVVAVVDEENNFQGIIFMNDIRNIIFKPELYDKIRVDELMYMPEPLVEPSDPMEEIALKFQESGNYNLPVIKDGKYLGFVSRARVFSQYRKLLREFSDE